MAWIAFVRGTTVFTTLIFQRTKLKIRPARPLVARSLARHSATRDMFALPQRERKNERTNVMPAGERDGRTCRAPQRGKLSLESGPRRAAMSAMRCDLSCTGSQPKAGCLCGHLYCIFAAVRSDKENPNYQFLMEWIGRMVEKESMTDRLITLIAFRLICYR